MKRSKKGLKSAVAVLAMTMLLAGCNVEISGGKSSDQEQSSSSSSSSSESSSNSSESSSDSSESTSNDKNDEYKIAYRFADKEEGFALLWGNTDYYNKLNQNDLDYRTQKKDATLDDLKEFTQKQILEFSQEEKDAIAKSIHAIEDILKENNLALPPMDEMIFVKTTQLEEGGAAAYTHKNEIYFGDESMAAYLSDDETVLRVANALTAHEIFHCLTRNNPDFREAIYSIINFKIQDKDFELGPDTNTIAYSNPDVDHRNSYATFNLNGVERDCFILLTTKPFEKEGDNFMENIGIGLVPVDDTNTYLGLGTDVNPADFFAVVGQNTGYVIDPEECMADNFSYAIVYGKDGIEGNPYPTPEIIEKILDYLKK